MGDTPDVPVLWVTHAESKLILPGVRKVVCSRKVDEFTRRRLFRRPDSCIRRLNMLWTIFVILLILWLLGFSLHIAGGLIHLLLVVAVVVLVINLVTGRRVV
jgi:hypothetical protein